MHETSRYFLLFSNLLRCIDEASAIIKCMDVRGYNECSSIGPGDHFVAIETSRALAFSQTRVTRRYSWSLCGWYISRHINTVGDFSHIDKTIQSVLEDTVLIDTQPDE